MAVRSHTTNHHHGLMMTHRASLRLTRASSTYVPFEIRPPIDRILSFFIPDSKFTPLWKAQNEVKWSTTSLSCFSPSRSKTEMVLSSSETPIYRDVFLSHLLTLKNLAVFEQQSFTHLSLFLFCLHSHSSPFKNNKKERERRKRSKTKSARSNLKKRERERERQVYFAYFNKGGLSLPPSGPESGPPAKMQITGYVMLCVIYSLKPPTHFNPSTPSRIDFFAAY